MLDEIKKCPFCAEDIKGEAIKCRYCGEMLDGSPRATQLGSPTYETKEFLIPFPEGSAPTRVTFDFDSLPDSEEAFFTVPVFPKEYIKEIGMKKPGRGDRTFWSGLIHTWAEFRPYFLDRVNELGQEGWELTEPFDCPSAGQDVATLMWYSRRFKAEPHKVHGLLGSKKRQRFAGARFMLKRATYS